MSDENKPREFCDTGLLLSNRVRPDSEAAPWVVEEIKKLEQKSERYRAALDEIKNYTERMAKDALHPSGPTILRMCEALNPDTKEGAE